MDLRASRDEISSKAIFVLTIAAAILSPFSLWRFPTWLNQNGGAVALIPYCVCVIMVAMPLMFLELSLGQFMQRAGTGVWRVVPLFKGLSISAMLVSLIRSSLNLAVASWAGYFLYLTTFGHVVMNGCVPNVTLERGLEVKVNPLTDVLNRTGTVLLGERLEPQPNDQWWMSAKHATAKNFTSFKNRSPDRRFMTRTEYTRIDDVTESYAHLLRPQPQLSLLDTNVSSSMINQTLNSTKCYLQYQHLWSDELLQATDNVAQVGVSVIPVFVGIVITVVVCLTLVGRGVNSNGKILCFVTSLAFLTTFALLAGACVERTEDAIQGIQRLLETDFSHLKSPKTWFTCVQHVLVTHCLAINVLPSLGSYQRWNNNTLRDTLGLCFLVAFTNVLATVTIWAILGNMDIHATTTTTDGMFESLPYALSRLPHPHVWTTVFCVLVFLVAISSSAIFWQTVVLSLIDTSSKMQRMRVLVAMGVASLAFLVAIPLSLQNGIYIYRFLDEVINGPLLLCVISLFQCLVIGLLYGGQQFYDNLETMTGYKPFWWIKISWISLCPLVLMATITHYAYEVHKSPLSLGREPHFHFMAKVMLGVTVVLVTSPVVMAAVWVFASGRGGCARKIRQALHPRLEGYQIPLRWRIEGTFHKFTSL